jgi:hypothetical protein
MIAFEVGRFSDLGHDAAPGPITSGLKRGRKLGRFVAFGFEYDCEDKTSLPTGSMLEIRLRERPMTEQIVTIGLT